MRGSGDKSAAHASIRPAEPADEARLREIARLSKGYWGYDTDRVREWAAALDFAPRRLAEAEHYVAEVEGHVAAWAALVLPRDRVCILDDLWVEPVWIGRGLGSALVRLAAERARDLGATRLEWEAEPRSVGFYEKLGARHLRDETSSWGRALQVMAVDVSA